MRSAEARLIHQLRQGDPEAGHRFVRDYYPGVYRYLLYLTGRSEMAEDLTQETFLHAWRGLAAFEGRASLRVWLHRIARREFLQVLRSQRRAPAEQVMASLEEAADVVTGPVADWVAAVELRSVLGKLPAEQAEVVVLHYLHGYDCAEIARIVGAHVSTIKYRLSRARLHLERELGEGDLLYLNEPAVPMRQWAWLPLDQMYALETRFFMRRAADQNAPRPGARTEDGMERREFLRQAAVGAAGLVLTEPEKEIVDSRLTQKVTCAFKGTALSDLCEKLKSDTGIPVTAGPSVADEKVTLFCEKLPLREVMRQLSRPFGYTWLRSGTPGQYRYELVQDLRSQLLEEELRNRDRNAALLALEKDLEQYRPYLDLSPDEALARAKTASPAEKPILEELAGKAWGPLHVYFRLSSQEMAALLAGQEVKFSEAPRPGEKPRPEMGSEALSPEIARGVLQSLRFLRLVKTDEGWEYSPGDPPPAALPPAALPEARAWVSVRLDASDLGQFQIGGTNGVFTIGPDGGIHWEGSYSGNAGRGRSSAVQKTSNAAANAALAHDPALAARVTAAPMPGSAWTAGNEGPERASLDDKKVTSAEVLEALHRATGMPIVSDFYSRLFKRDAVSVRDQPLFEALNQLGDAMHMRWRKEAGTTAESTRTSGTRSWLQLRSLTYFDDRRKEVPNRLLSRWAIDRRQHGVLSLDILVEIAQLSDAQLDAAEMAEGAREWWGLAEWDLASGDNARRHLRYLAQLTPEQRREAMSPAGLPFTRMSLAQQQQFMAFGLGGEPLRSMDELAGAALRVEYTQPGQFQWGEPGWSGYYTRWVVPLGPGPQDRRVLRPPVIAPTRQEALAAVRRVDPQLREALLQAVDRADPRSPQALDAFEEKQIFPTQRNLTFVYIPGATNARSIFVQSCADYSCGYCNYRLR